MDAEPAPMGLTVIPKLWLFQCSTFIIQCSQVLCVNNTENFTSMDAGNNTLQLVQEVLVGIKALWNFCGSEINLCEVLSNL